MVLVPITIWMEIVILVIGPTIRSREGEYMYTHKPMRNMMGNGIMVWDKVMELFNINVEYMKENSIII